jgi:aerobic carbon-monoxide dehydrogenase small subunit
MKLQQIQISVNSRDYSLEVMSNKTLIEVLRDNLGLLGTKYSCGEGECGACTVIMNGKAALSCLILAVEADGSKILTIEGLSNENNKLHHIQQSFIDKGAVQCGFCTPGMVMSTKALLDKNHNPNRQEIERAIDGNICRCTGYIKIIDAIEDAAIKINSKNSHLK